MQIARERSVVAALVSGPQRFRRAATPVAARCAGPPVIINEQGEQWWTP